LQQGEMYGSLQINMQHQWRMLLEHATNKM